MPSFQQTNQGLGIIGLLFQLILLPDRLDILCIWVCFLVFSYILIHVVEATYFASIFKYLLVCMDMMRMLRSVNLVEMFGCVYGSLGSFAHSSLYNYLVI